MFGSLSLPTSNTAVAILPVGGAAGEKEDNIGSNVDFDTNVDNESIVFPVHLIALSSQEREIF